MTMSSLLVSGLSVSPEDGEAKVGTTCATTSPSPHKMLPVTILVKTGRCCKWCSYHSRSDVDDGDAVGGEKAAVDFEAVEVVEVVPAGRGEAVALEADGEDVEGVRPFRPTGW